MFKYLAFILLTTASTCNSNDTEEIASTNTTTNNIVEKSSTTPKHYQLHDIWVLTDIKGEAISKEKFVQGAPTLEIFVEEQRIGGFSGCNNYSAAFDSLTENSIHIGPILSTKKFCIGIDENSFFQNMNKVTHYKLESLQLDLYENDSLLLSFKKID